MNLMKMEKIDPPGSWCHNETVMEIVRKYGGRTFVEIGCGKGDMSYRLCKHGLKGVGIDFSPYAIELARDNLKEFIKNRQYDLIQSDVTRLNDAHLNFDFGLSMMVMEHVADDVLFLKKIANLIRPNGYVIVTVPARKDKWGIEDETVGHMRRYDRKEFKEKLSLAGLSDVKVWSTAVPVANVLFHTSNFIVRHSSEVHKIHKSMREQTETSGIREIPFKTVFPSWCKLILNRFTMYPFFLLQRFFYESNLGLTMIGVGRVKKE